MTTTADPELFWETDRIQLLSQTPPKDTYFKAAYEFMKSWQEGQTHFSMHTSGSTGTPKTIELTRTQMAGSAAMTGRMLDLGEGTVALVCLNTAYIGGLMMLVRGMELGWKLIVTRPSSNPLQGLHATPDFVSMVPSQLSDCLADPATAELTEAIGTVLLGGAPVSAGLATRIRGMKNKVFQSYGMTETVSHVAVRRLSGMMEEDDYHLLPHITAGVDDRGCLHVEGPMTDGMRIQTNDVVAFTSPDAFRWVGRADNIINSGGVKISLDQTDAVISALFEELNLPITFFSWFERDEKLGQKLILIAHRDAAPVDEKAVLAEIRKRLTPYQTPKRIYFAAQFARTPTDKIDKRRTADQLFKSFHG